MSKRSLLLAGLGLCCAATAQAECIEHLLVSGYFSNNVAIFDACTGEFLRQLDDQGRIRGAQAVRLNPADGLLYVVSEGNDQILRYDARSYAYVDRFAQLAGSVDPTGVDIGPIDDAVYVASYAGSNVLRLDGGSGAVLGESLSASSGLAGADNGMAFGPDGWLYVPGYDSSSVARVNPATGQVQGSFIAPGAGGLVQARGLLFEPDGQTLLVTGEGSGTVQRFRLSDGQLVDTPISGLSRPTGIALAHSGELLVISGTRVQRFDRVSGAALGPLLNLSAGEIRGGTFLALVPRPPVDASQIGTQYWIFGAGQVQGQSLQAELVSANGGVYGADLDPASIVRQRWGALQMSFQACDRATLSLTSTGPDSAGFGDIGYAVIRLVDSAATLDCRTQDFAQVSAGAWMSGAWYGPDRSGEGIVLEVAAEFSRIPRGGDETWAFVAGLYPADHPVLPPRD